MPGFLVELSMQEMLRSNDAVLISFAESVLRQAGIACMIADQHMSIVEGSIGAFPRRLLVQDEDRWAARRALVEAGLDAWLIGDGEDRTPMFYGYLIATAVMLLGAFVAWAWGVDAERKSLEEIAPPLTSYDEHGNETVHLPV